MVPALWKLQWVWGLLNTGAESTCLQVWAGKGHGQCPLSQGVSPGTGELLDLPLVAYRAK